MQCRRKPNKSAIASAEWAVAHAVYYPPTTESIAALGPLYRSTDECIRKALVILAGMALSEREKEADENSTFDLAVNKEACAG